MIYQICDIMMSISMRLEAFLNLSFEPQPEISVNRIKKCRSDCKANTEGGAPGNFLYFATKYKITFR